MIIKDSKIYFLDNFGVVILIYIYNYFNKLAF